MHRSPQATDDPLSRSPSPSAVIHYSANSSQTVSVQDLEKAEDIEKADGPAASYIVPVLPAGQKNAKTTPTSPWIRFRLWFNPYRILFTVAFVLNIVGITVASAGRWQYAERHSAGIALGNLATAVACRSEFCLRYLVYWPIVRVFQKWSPLWWRIFLTSLLQHVGGIHSGCAASGIAWFIYSVVRTFRLHALEHTPKVVLAWAVIALVVATIVMVAATPWIRHHHHNFFEYHHRLAGWASIVFIWIFVCTSDNYDAATGTFHIDARRTVGAQEFWYTLFVTLLVVGPWLTVRKVPVEITTPSPRVAVVKFHKGVQQGLLGRVSRSALGEYHGFGIISEGAKSGAHYMIAGVQGDWTRQLVADPPKHLYTREMKFAGLPYLAHLFRRGICICTGSGIGAVLSTCVQLDNWFLIWIGSDMEKTFGPVLFDMIDRNIPKDRYILFDTKEHGRRPDTMQMLRDIYDSFQAEVIIITSNPRGNAELMQGCKENGMHSFGPLWDS
ncbi:hypothetical protein PsYK624_085750 [Phanerochaete sordida]|uniref:Non-ribosomal peptide synthetase n=1 Tax=Phanerochaete sordida TaxID=48140 RepID=A0A9P3GCL1_9APHY|nr:hypothetical protein PsYK624_085750 [Phanerochaete sordida]